jgi:hypothetical protein
MSSPCKITSKSTAPLRVASEPMPPSPTISNKSAVSLLLARQVIFVTKSLQLPPGRSGIGYVGFGNRWYRRPCQGLRINGRTIFINDGVRAGLLSSAVQEVPMLVHPAKPMVCVPDSVVMSHAFRPYPPNKEMS